MISYIKGPLAAIEGDVIVVEAGAVGMAVHVPLSLLPELPALGNEITVHTYFQVREDSMTLYGFLNRQDRDMFKQLLGVSGIGPKGALGILSAMRPDDLRLAIVSGDVKALSKAPGIGNKTAQRMILDLKDKISPEEILGNLADPSASETGDSSLLGMAEAAKEAVMALVSLGYTKTEASRAVRPQCLRDYIGQEKIKSTLDIYIEAAKTRGEALDHVLFYGPPGLGKTTLAGIIANEMGSSMKVTSGPAIEKPGEMAAILNNLKEGDVLFVDEIHRLNRQVEEVLYPAMEDFAIDIMLGKDSAARSIRLDLPHFTLVGATTRAGLLTAPLRDRFGVIQRLEFYTPEELKVIILHSAKVLGVEIEEDGALELARRSRGTPRLANRLLKRVRDFAQVKYDGVITRQVTDFALDIMDVDKLGLDQNDRNILTMIIEKFSGGPVGLEARTRLIFRRQPAM